MAKPTTSCCSASGRGRKSLLIDDRLDIVEDFLWEACVFIIYGLAVVLVTVENICYHWLED